MTMSRIDLHKSGSQVTMVTKVAEECYLCVSVINHWNISLYL